MSRSRSIAAVAVVFSVCAAHAQTPVHPPDLQKTRGTRVPNVELIAEDSTTFHLAILAGKPIIVSAIFTSCPQTCSYITTSLRDALAEIGEPGVGYQVLTVSFDPADGPSELRGYRKKLSLPPGWRLAVATPDNLTALLDAIDFQYVAMDEGGFAHANLITILDPEMKVSGYMHGVMYDAAELQKQLDAAARNTSLVRKARPLLIVVAALGALTLAIVLIATKKKTA